VGFKPLISTEEKNKDLKSSFTPVEEDFFIILIGGKNEREH